MVVHFPDTALTFTNESIVDRHGREWIVSTQPRHDTRLGLYRMRVDLRAGDLRISGCFNVKNQVVDGRDADLDLRLFALQEIKKYIDHGNIVEGFTFELPYRYML